MVPIVLKLAIWSLFGAIAILANIVAATELANEPWMRITIHIPSAASALFHSPPIQSTSNISHFTIVPARYIVPMDLVGNDHDCSHSTSITLSHTLPFLSDGNGPTSTTGASSTTSNISNLAIVPTRSIAPMNLVGDDHSRSHSTSIALSHTQLFLPDGDGPTSATGTSSATSSHHDNGISGTDESTVVDNDDFGFFEDMPSADYDNNYLFATHDAPSMHAPLSHTNTAQSAPPPRDHPIVANTTAITTTIATVASTSITHVHRAPPSTGLNNHRGP